jgi:hypothetical protein
MISGLRGGNGNQRPLDDVAGIEAVAVGLIDFVDLGLGPGVDLGVDFVGQRV